MNPSSDESVELLRDVKLRCPADPAGGVAVAAAAAVVVAGVVGPTRRRSSRKRTPSVKKVFKEILTLLIGQAKCETILLD